VEHADAGPEREQRVILQFVARHTRYWSPDPPKDGPRAGGPDPFDAALVAQLPRLRRYAVALAGDLTMADDLVQDTVERALSRRATLADGALLYPWLRSILHNLRIDEYRRRRSQGPAVDIDELADAIALSSPAIDRHGTRDLIRAMERLSLEHRQILLLIGIEGMSYKEIAAELDIPIGTVMSRLARAREQLRRRLDESEAVARARQTVIRLPIDRP
jgi:RNA polymerase sigma-70 factor (ECF subfamily)